MTAARRNTVPGVGGELTVRRLASTIRRSEIAPPEYVEISVQMSRGARAAVRRHLVESRQLVPEWLFRDLLVVLSTADAYEDELTELRASVASASTALAKLREALEPIAPEPDDEPPAGEPLFRSIGRWHLWERTAAGGRGGS